MFHNTAPFLYYLLLPSRLIFLRCKHASNHQSHTASCQIQIRSPDWKYLHPQIFFIMNPRNCMCHRNNHIHAAFAEQLTVPSTISIPSTRTPTNFRLHSATKSKIIASRKKYKNSINIVCSTAVENNIC